MYPLGTQVKQKHPERKKGVVRGHRNELDIGGHPTGRTINWVVYEEHGTYNEFTDDEIGQLNPRCPKGKQTEPRWVYLFLFDRSVPLLP